MYKHIFNVHRLKGIPVKCFQFQSRNFVHDHVKHFLMKAVKGIKCQKMMGHSTKT